MVFRNGKSVAVFGAGIAGLTVAHEFSKLGYSVNVFEANSEPGGFFRSVRRKEDSNMPSEFSWHGMGPWYNNLFELLKDIPFDETSSLFDRILSRPIDFCLAPNEGAAQFGDSKSKNVDVKNLFSLTRREKWFWAWLMLKPWCSNLRSARHYSTLNAHEVWKPYLGPLALKTWRPALVPRWDLIGAMSRFIRWLIFSGKIF